MDDGTTAFSMAVARKDLEMIKIFLETKHASDIDPIDLAKRTFLEMDRDVNDCDLIFKQILENSLREHNILLTKIEIPYINLHLRRAKQPTWKLRMTQSLHPILAEHPAWHSGQQTCPPT